MKTYRCKHSVEAMLWTDTPLNREMFTAWFSSHSAVFKTRGSEVVFPEGNITEGEWILFSDGEFIGMDGAAFMDTYEDGW